LFFSTSIAIWNIHDRVRKWNWHTTISCHNRTGLGPGKWVDKIDRRYAEATTSHIKFACNHLATSHPHVETADFWYCQRVAASQMHVGS
jgi:hypothetical protein